MQAHDDSTGVEGFRFLRYPSKSGAIGMGMVLALGLGLELGRSLSGAGEVEGAQTHVAAGAATGGAVAVWLPPAPLPSNAHWHLCISPTVLD